MMPNELTNVLGCCLCAVPIRGSSQKKDVTTPTFRIKGAFDSFLCCTYVLGYKQGAAVIYLFYFLLNRTIR